MKSSIKIFPANGIENQPNSVSIHLESPSDEKISDCDDHRCMDESDDYLQSKCGHVERLWNGYNNGRRKTNKTDGSPIATTKDHSNTGQGLAPDLTLETYGCYDTMPSGNPDVIRDQIETTMNRNLMQYFARLSDPDKPEKYIDLEFVQSLVDSGADIETTDRYGQTALHEVARAWCVDVARFLIEKLNADVNVGDEFGRTPLHVAASVNYPEMCHYLISVGAKKDALTHGERQTPLFYAARSDSEDSLITLLKHGCKYKRITDFKKRTPLALAAEMNRQKTVKLLLAMGAPADRRDDSGQPAIVPIVSRMGSMANTALDQFHTIDFTNRKEYYHLWKLEPGSYDEGDQIYSGVLQTIVSNRQYELVMHPVIERLLEVMWQRFGKRRVILSVILQIAFILSWSVFAVSKTWYRRHKYELPDEAWRLAVFCLALALTFWQIIEEILEYRISLKKFNTWKAWRQKEISRDELYCHPMWPEEASFLKQEKALLGKSYVSYFDDGWNIFDWLCYFLLSTCAAIHLVDVFAHTLILARWTLRIQAFTLILLFLRFMKVVRAFAFLGPLIVILGHVALDVVKFIFLYMQFFVPFALAFYMMIGGYDQVSETVINYNLSPENASNIHVKGFKEINDLVFSLFRLTMGNDYEYSAMIQIDKIFVQLMLGFWLSASSILCINLFIALLSDTFARVYDNARANARMQRADIVLGIMFAMYANKRRAFYKYLSDNCNPESLYYEMRNFYVNEEDTKKAVIESRNLLKEVQHQLDVFMSLETEQPDVVDDEGVEISARRKSIMASALRKVKDTAVSPRVNEEGENVTVASGVTAEQLKDLRDYLEKQQKQLVEKFTTEMNDMKELLRDIAIVVSGVSSGQIPQPPSGVPPTVSKKKRKKKPIDYSADEATVEATGIIEVKPPEQMEPQPPDIPMQLEVYSRRQSRRPKIRFFDQPTDDDTEA